MSEPDRPPVPPFNLETATKKVKAAQDAWNTCDPATVAGAYTPGMECVVQAVNKETHAV